MSSRAERERRYRQVPLTNAHLARFHTELPAVVTYLERRLIPGHWRWGIGAIVYGLTTLTGLCWFDWSPMLVLLHLMLSQWIALIAEVLALRRLHRRGITRLVAFNHVYRFVEAVRRVITRPRRSWDPPQPMIRESDLLDSEIPADSSDKTSPRDLAGVLLFFGAIATGLVAGVSWFVERAVFDGLLAQPVALVVLGAASLLQLQSQVRTKLAPPLPGASWSVEFSPGLRIMSVMLLGMIIPGVIADNAEGVRELAIGFPILIAAWGLVTLIFLPMWRRPLASLRDFRDAAIPTLDSLATTSRAGTRRQ
jgi:hypothetical protein